LEGAFFENLRQNDFDSLGAEPATTKNLKLAETR
jgi:hypothetical protein